MSTNENVFFEEWRRCLKEHYLHVIRTQDAITEPTLRHVLMETGFTEAELDWLRGIDADQADYIESAPVEIEAEALETLYEEDVYTEDMAPQAEPEAVLEEAAPLVEELPPEEELFPLEEETPLAPPEEAPKPKKKKDDPPPTTQLSLF